MHRLFGKELYASPSPNEQNIRILVFLEAFHQRLLTAREVLNNLMNRSTLIHKGRSADCHFSVGCLTYNPGTPMWCSERVSWAPCRKLIIYLVWRAVIHLNWNRFLSLNLFFLPTICLLPLPMEKEESSHAWPCDQLQK